MADSVSVHSKRVMGRQFRLKDGKTRRLVVSVDSERVMAGFYCVLRSTGLKPLTYTKGGRPGPTTNKKRAAALGRRSHQSKYSTGVKPGVTRLRGGGKLGSRR